MKFYQTYKDVLENVGEISHAWFTTFNIDPLLLERYLLAPIGKMQASEMRTAEDYEGLNTELASKDIKIWYDYRGLNSLSPKRTVIPLLPVDPVNFGAELFHPKVIFIKGDKEAWLITGSANITIAAWRDNRESIIVRPITLRSQAEAILSFFNALGGKIEILSVWASTLPSGQSDWQFVHSFLPGHIFSTLTPSSRLSIWSPYFSVHLSSLLKRIVALGFDTIDLIPDMTLHGKIRITAADLGSIAIQDHIHFKTVKNDNLEIFSHAKAWLSDDKIAVGSWNCTYKGTGLQSGDFNIEAGIIAAINSADRELLLDALEDIPYNKLESSTPEELEQEWEQVLENFTYCCRIIADWQNFTYAFESQDSIPNYMVILPDSPNITVPLGAVNGRNFRMGFEKVLANKTFQVYDEDKNEVYRGYLEEQHSTARPVMGYLTVNDLIDSLLRDPSGTTGSSKVVYDLDSETGESGPSVAFLDYQNAHSYYRMFVAFQLLSDRLELLRSKPDELDRLLFRLPGSLLQIRLLISRMMPDTEDEKLFYWFISQEFNRCALQIKKTNTTLQLDSINTLSLLQDLRPNRKDKAFLKLLSKQFAYDF